jgi:hypothetical protein
MLLLSCFLDNWRMDSQQSLLGNWYEPRRTWSICEKVQYNNNLLDFLLFFINTRSFYLAFVVYDSGEDI